MNTLVVSWNYYKLVLKMGADTVCIQTMYRLMKLVDGAISFFPNTPTKANISNNSTKAVSPEISNNMANDKGRKMAASKKGDTTVTVSKRRKAVVDDNVSNAGSKKSKVSKATKVTNDDDWEEDQTAVSQPRVGGTNENTEQRSETEDDDSSSSDDDDEDDEDDLNGTQLKSPEQNLSEVSDLSCADRLTLIKMLEESRRTIIDLQEAMPMKKKQKVVLPSTADEKKIDVEVSNILRYEIVRWMKFHQAGWNVWSEEEGTVCKMICDRIVNWPMDVTTDYKKKMWCRLFEPRLNRKLTLIKNKITGKMKEIFMREYQHSTPIENHVLHRSNTYQCCSKASMVQIMPLMARHWIKSSTRLQMRCCKMIS